jgi:hypothetical protein
MTILLFWSLLIPAPLEGIANPEVSPNPAKALWYFLGIQELLLHFHPLVGAIIIPILALGTLFLLPFFDIDIDSVGVYFRSWRGRYLSLFAFGISLIITPAWVALDEFFLHWSSWLPNWPSLIFEGLIPFAVALLGLLMLDEFVKRAFRASMEERILHLFVFLLTALVVLTIIGIFFRGPGMSLYWPWEMPIH